MRLYRRRCRACLFGRNATSTPVAQEGENGVCVLELNPLYAILSSAVSFYVPCVAMLCIYYRLHRYARRQVKSIRMTYKSSLGGQSQATVDDDRDAVGSPLRDKMSDHKAAITLGIIMGVFLLSWGPFFTVNLVGALCGPRSVPPLVFAVFTWLGYVNSTMNPVIYSVFNRQFRDAFKRVLRLRRRYPDGATAAAAAAYRGCSDWDEPPSRSQTAARRRTDEDRMSARPSVSDVGGFNSVMRSSSSCRDVAFALNTSCL